MATYILTAAQLNNRILNSFSIPSSGGSVDPDAQAFITAAGITDPTQQSAINTLVVGLKDDGLWTSMQAIYPFVGGTASSHKYNLKDPRDLDAAFRLQFFGGMTHDANGITGNGTNAYAKTFQVNALSIGVYSRSTNASGVYIGKAGTLQDIEGNNADEFFAWLYGNQFTDGSSQVNRSTGTAPYNKFYNVVGKNALGANTRLFIYRNGVQVGPDYATDGWYNNSTVHLCAAYFITRNFPSLTIKSEVINTFSNVNIAFASLSDSILNATQNLNLNNRIETFQTSLSRNV